MSEASMEKYTEIIVEQYTEAKMNTYSEAIALGNLFMVEKLMELEKGRRRKAKKLNVYDEKKKLLLKAFWLSQKVVDLKKGRQQLLCQFVKEEQKIPFLIDLAFTSPFAPYELKFKQEDFRQALLYICTLLDQNYEVVDDILKNQKDALKSQRKIDWWKVALFGVGGTLLFGYGGWLIAPAIGTALGTAAGYTGAAATAHGLALLGGGTLASGGAGMAGGMWFVTSAGAIAGLGISGGSPFLLQLGAAQAKVEILKLQVTYKTVFVTNQIHYNWANESIEKLVNMKKEIMEELIREKKFNEGSSNRIKEIKDTIDALNNAINWMRKNKVKV